jgi:hypothetical protein
MIANGILQTWKSAEGKEGFLLYSEFQARTAKTILESSRYSIAERQHIFTEWNMSLQFVTTDEMAYDSFEIDNYTHFRRRLKEQADFFEDDLAIMNGDRHWLKGEELAMQKVLAEKKLKEWRGYSNYFAKRSEEDLPPDQKLYGAISFIISAMPTNSRG